MIRSDDSTLIYVSFWNKYLYFIICSSIDSRIIWYNEFFMNCKLSHFYHITHCVEHKLFSNFTSSFHRIQSIYCFRYLVNIHILSIIRDLPTHRFIVSKSCHNVVLVTYYNVTQFLPYTHFSSHTNHSTQSNFEQPQRSNALFNHVLVRW